MIKFENDCCDCGQPCFGNACINRNVPHLYCDECGYEVDDLFEYDGQQICEDCLKEIVPKVDVDAYIDDIDDYNY